MTTFKHINKALLNNGFMILSNIKGKYRASMHFPYESKRIFGNDNSTMENAMETLNMKLRENLNET